MNWQSVAVGTPNCDKDATRKGRIVPWRVDFLTLVGA